MSLYNQLFGENEITGLLLKCLNLTKGDFGRFRDIYLDGDHIAVYTRCGGGNREEYQGTLDALKAHPCWVRDADDDFDCTYCTIYFRFPDEMKEDLQALSKNTKVVTPSQKFADLIKAMREGTAPPPPPAIVEVMKKVTDQLGGQS